MADQSRSIEAAEFVQECGQEIGWPMIFSNATNLFYKEKKLISDQEYGPVQTYQFLSDHG
jgi:hypothetical protein